MVRPCEQCGETENVKTFVHFDGQRDERLCWDCRWPIIEERLRSDDETERDEAGETQASLGDY